MVLEGFGADFDFFTIRITESFYRTLIQEVLSVWNVFLQDVKLFLEVEDGNYVGIFLIIGAGFAFLFHTWHWIYAAYGTLPEISWLS